MKTITKVVLQSIVSLLIALPLPTMASTAPPINFEGYLVDSQDCQTGLAIVGQPYINGSQMKESTLCVQIVKSTRIGISLQKLVAVVKLAFPQLSEYEATVQALKRETFISISGSFYGDSIVIDSIDSRFE